MRISDWSSDVCSSDLFLTKTGGYKSPIVPPGMHNKGNFIVSLCAMCAWLAPQAEALGVEIDPGFAAAETLHEHSGRQLGVRIGDIDGAQNCPHKPPPPAGPHTHAQFTVPTQGPTAPPHNRPSKRP